MKLECYTYDKRLIELQPLKHKNKPPSWWTKLKKVYNVLDLRSGVEVPTPTIKACPGVVDYIRKPIIMKLWSDVIFKVFPDGRVRMAEPLHSNGAIQGNTHEREQHGTELYPNATVFKLANPWVLKASDRTEFMCTEVHYTEDLREHGIMVSPGIVNFYDQHSFNVFLVFPIKEEEYTVKLKYGTPLMSLYPMTDKKVDISLHHVSAQECNDILNHFPPTFLGRYYSRKHTLRN